VERELNILEKFFGGPWNKFVEKYRFFIMGGILAWSAATCYFVTQLGPLTEQENFVPEDHPVLQAADIAQEEFYSGDTDIALRIEFVWGISGLDKSDVSMWDPFNSGKIVWDNQMDLSPKANQQAILEFCDKLEVIIEESNSFFIELRTTERQ